MVAALALGLDRGVGQSRLGKVGNLSEPDQGGEVMLEHRGLLSSCVVRFAVLVRLKLERPGVCPARRVEVSPACPLGAGWTIIPA